MSRLQLALRVPDLAAATDFYTTLFGRPPHKLRDGYANFALDDPPLKLVLFDTASSEVAELDHLGIEVDTTDEVTAAVTRYRDAGFDVDVREQELCCHAVQDKLWIDGADGHRWEVYTVTDDLLGDGGTPTDGGDSPVVVGSTERGEGLPLATGTAATATAEDASCDCGC